MRVLALLPAALLSACAATTNGFDAGTSDIAAQRMRFVVEAVCFNNPTRSAQDRAARALGFPVRQRDEEGVLYVNPGTLTFLRLGPSPELGFDTPEGEPRTVSGHGCSVGSPAVGVDAANRMLGQIIAPRLAEGSALIRAPLGAGRADFGGVGLFFEDFAATVAEARTILTDEETSESVLYDHPTILVIRD